ncbi:MAG: hypothetical protein HY744_11645 [Deltaproteobacteria bacterium]|nr:hypothetical protein [Deltaproteobacteria bacterium]
MRWWRTAARTVAPAGAGLALLLSGGVARGAGVPTIYDNYQNFPIGSRAAGMGGAYTALSCDEAALQYNPAALACAEQSRLELAANAYIIQALYIPDALGPGEDADALTYHSVPSIVGGVRLFLDGDPQTHDGRLAFGLSVAVPHSLALKGDPANPDKPNYFSFSVRDDITTADVGLGYKIGRYVALGLSLGAVVRTAEGRTSFLLATDQAISWPDLHCGNGQDGAPCWPYLSALNEWEELAVGARAKLGLRVTPTPELSFGLAVTSPTLDVYGTAEAASNTSIATVWAYPEGSQQFWPVFFSVPRRLSGASNVGFPLRVALGGAYSTASFTVSLDLSANYYVQPVYVAYDLEEQQIQGIPPLTKQDLRASELVLTRDFQPNANLGVEFAVAEMVAIDVGAFTDISAVSELDVQEQDQDRIHMFGGSVALGLLGKQTRGWFGASFEIGMADVKVATGDYNFETFLEQGLGIPFDGWATATRWTLAGVIGSNYSFLPEPKAEPPADKPPAKPAPAGAQK